MINLIVGLFVVCFEQICCSMFLATFLEWKKYEDKRQIFIFIGMVAIVFLNSYFIENTALKMLFNIMVISFAMNFLFYGKYVKKISLVVMLYAISACVDYFSLVLMQKLMAYNVMEADDVQNTLLILFSRVLLFTVMLIIVKNWDKNSEFAMMSVKNMLRFFSLPVMTLIIIVVMARTFDENYNDMAKNTIIIIVMVLAVMNVILIFLLQDLMKSDNIIRETQVQKERVSHEIKLYQNMSQNIEQQRAIMHEYNNQLNCIKSMLDHNQIVELKQYTTGISNKFQTVSEVVNTNNVIVNAIINSKYKEALENNIVMTMKVNDLSMCRISNEDIVTILSNLLNNAVEACKKVDGKRVVMLKFIKEDDAIILSVKNTCEESALIVNDSVATTKEEKKMHGYGIKNIKDTVDKYDGSYHMESRDGYFYFAIMI